MSKPIRIQLSRRKGWKMPPNTVVVARGPGRKFWNPYKVGCRYMLATGEVKTITAKIAVEMFEVWAKVPTGSGKRPYVEMVKRELRGKNLACWCPVFRCKCGESVDLPDNFGWKQTENTCPVCRAIINRTPCHADVLLEIANA